MENIGDNKGGNNIRVQHENERPSTNISGHVEAQNEPEPKAKKGKMTTSNVWLFFDNLGVCADGKP